MTRAHSFKILFGITGSIAAVKAPEIARQFIDKGFKVNCALTHSAEKFVAPLALSSFTGEKAYSDIFNEDAHLMPHVKLAEEASVMVIAPVNCTTLARCATGLVEDLVSLLFLTTKAPVVMAPAMHTSMWEHPATQANIKILKDRGVRFVGPYQGPLADMSRGEGRMAEPEEIVKVVEDLLKVKS